MRGWLVGLLAMTLAPWALAADASPGNKPEASATEVVIAAETWAAHTDADGSGLGWDILRKVFEPVGVHLRTRSVPYTRSIGLVKRGEADAWVGSYRDEVPWAIYPHWNYDADRISALALKGAPVPTLANLGEHRLVWMRGYGYERYLPNLAHFQEIERRGGILSMLDLDHADYYIDARTEVDDVLRQSPNPENYRITYLTQLKLYVAFGDTARGREFAELFDERMARLVENGELRPVFAHWGQPYPFDPEPESHHASP
ncbi:substrate-binding periplasmic protein [Pseudomonas tohonis]|uniref:substrate-binding periplasmic protein n=1 Tax=Pseudomonas tohonis TaxID=2725477 RepID=UPI0027E03E27|nr:transporter substrate-binding domain-containing protein [Pseudomonas tohonis]